MTKLIEEKIEIARPPKGKSSIIWRGRKYKIDQVVDSWHDTSRWWAGEGEKVFYRIKTDRKLLYDIYLETNSTEWFLYRIID